MFPNDYFPMDGWVDYETPLDATNLNLRDNEIRAIENALGRFIVPTGTVSLDSWLRVTGTPSELTFMLGANCIGGPLKVSIPNDATIGVYGSSYGSNPSVPYYGVLISMAQSQGGSWTREFSWAHGDTKIASIGMNATGGGPQYVYINAKQNGAATGWQNPHFVIRSDTGRVGIGEPNPAAKFHVVGGSGGTNVNDNFSLIFRLVGQGYEPGLFVSHTPSDIEENGTITYYGGQTRLAFSGYTNFWGTLAWGNEDVITVGRNKNVGIGTSGPLPAAKLEVAGSVKLGVDGDSALGFYGAIPQTRREVSTSGTTQDQLTSLRNALQSTGLIALVS